MTTNAALAFCSDAWWGLILNVWGGQGGTNFTGGGAAAHPGLPWNRHWTAITYVSDQIYELNFQNIRHYSLAIKFANLSNLNYAVYEICKFSQGIVFMPHPVRMIGPTFGGKSRIFTNFIMDINEQNDCDANNVFYVSIQPRGFPP